MNREYPYAGSQSVVTETAEYVLYVLSYVCVYPQCRMNLILALSFGMENVVVRKWLCTVARCVYVGLSLCACDTDMQGHMSHRGAMSSVRGGVAD